MVVLMPFPPHYSSKGSDTDWRQDTFGSPSLFFTPIGLAFPNIPLTPVEELLHAFPSLPRSKIHCHSLLQVSLNLK